MRMYTDLRSRWESSRKTPSRSSAATSPQGGGGGRSDLQLDGARAVGLERPLAGGPSVPATLGFGLCLVGSLTVLEVHLGTAQHCRIPFWFGVLFPACYAAVAILARSSLVLRRAGRVK